MKLTKFMCAAFAAAIALASCQKQETPAAAEKGELKAVTVSVNNVMAVKSASTADLEDKAAVITNYQVFFSNQSGSQFYQGKNADGTNASHYLTSVTAPVTFHYLDAAVKKVYVIANFGAEQNPADVAALEALVRTVASQQEDNITELALYGKAESLTETGAHTDTHPITKVYEASVTIKPMVARVEVNTFGVSFAKNALFNSVRFDKLAFDNYFPEALVSGTVSGERVRQEFVNYNDVAQLKAAQKTYFDGLQGDSWFADLVDASLTESGVQDVKVTRPNANAQVVDTELTGHCYAYHFFPAANATDFSKDGYPRLYAQVTTTDVQGYEAVQYVMTKNLKANDAVITNFEAGKIYRINYTFPDTLLENPLICADVTVTVEPWRVVAVTPEW